jgi:hypothetical protein
MKYKVLLLISLISFACITAQVKKPFIIETKVHTGLNLPLYRALDYLAREDIYAFDLSVRFPAIENDFWDKLYKYPVTGAGFSFWGLGNKEVLGTASVLYGFISIPAIRKERWSLNYNVSSGLAYLPKIFDVHNNHLNRAIGAHINIFMQLAIDARFKVMQHSEIVLEAGASHFSNGKTRSPNYGINAGTISAGFNYFFNETDKAKDKPEVPGFGDKYVQTLVFAAGSKVYDNLFGKKYLASSVSYNLDRRFSFKRRAGIGADLFYDGSLSEALAGESGIPVNDFTSLIRAGMHVSYSQQYRKLIGGVQMGYYVYTRYRGFTNIYHRVFLQYVITKHFAGNIAIKSHWGKADFPEFGIAYIL